MGRQGGQDAVAEKQHVHRQINLLPPEQKQQVVHRVGQFVDGIRIQVCPAGHKKVQKQVLFPRRHIIKPVKQRHILGIQVRHQDGTLPCRIQIQHPE